MMRSWSQRLAMTASRVNSEALRTRALALLTRRDLSRAELLAKLQVSASDVQDLLDELQERGWQDDARVVEIELRAAHSKGHGVLRLRQRLQQRGIATAMIETALATWSQDQVQPIELLRQRFAATALADDKSRARLLRFLIYRGYSQSQAYAAVRAFLQERRGSAAGSATSA